MATGDILAAVLDATGWQLHVKLEGMSPAGTYAIGAAATLAWADRANNTAKVVVSLTSEGYNTAGTLGTTARTVYGTRQVLMPYGEGTAKWIQSGTMTGAMVDGETVTQAVSGATATVVTNCPAPPLVLRGVTGTPDASNAWVGGTSGASFAPAATPAAYVGNVAREGVQGSDLWITVALDEFIHNDDSAITVNFLANLYSQGGNNSNAATNVAVTNTSTLDYAKVIARWLTVPYQRITASTFTVRALAFHRAAKNSNPVACVVFSASDGSTNRSVVASSMACYQETSGLWVSCYEGTFTSADFADNTVVTCNFVAYPWVGDADSVADSSGTAAPSQNLCTLPMLNDPDNDFGVTIAYVDPTSLITTNSTVSGLTQWETVTQAVSGATAQVCRTATGQVFVSAITGSPNGVNDWTGGTSLVTFTPTSSPTAQGSDANAAYDISQDATAQANPQATVGGAAVAIKTYNNANRSRNNADAGIIYLKQGRHKWAGATTTTTTNTWLKVTRASGVSNGQAPLANRVGAAQLNITKLWLYDVDFYAFSPTDCLTCYGQAAEQVWIDQCRFDAPSATSGSFGPVDQYGYVYQTGSTIARIHRLGLATTQVLARGITSTTMGGGAPCSVGNLCTGTGAFLSNLASDNLIFAYNRSVSMTALVVSMSTVAISTGLAEVGNVWELMAADTPFDCMFHDGSTVTSNNIIRWHNTVAGGRANFCYNDTATGYARTNTSCKYNSCYWLPTKHDDQNLAGRGGFAQLAHKAWSAYYGVGFIGNHSEDAQFPFKWGYSYTTGSAAGYTDDNSGAGGGGNGDYTLTKTSPCRNKVPTGEAVIPYDITGRNVSNSGSGAAGAYQPASGYMATGAGARNVPHMAGYHRRFGR